MKDPIEVDESHSLSDIFLIQKESCLLLKIKTLFPLSRNHQDINYVHDYAKLVVIIITSIFTNHCKKTPNPIFLHR